MEYNNLFIQAFIYLLATVVAVPIAKKIGLGSILGYLLAGIIIGPYALNLVNSHSESVMHFAEFGVVMMLFLVGLELRPATLWQLRRPLLITGGLQVLITMLVIASIAKLYGNNMATSLAIGMIFTSSSTAIVLQILNEKGWIKLDAGNTIFAILLFQDIAVIPMLALFPLLSNSAVKIDHHSLSGEQQAGLILLFIIGIILAGRYLIGPIFRFIASSRLHEAFTALALLLVIGITLAMQYIGLSPALGAFLAGLVLAESEYRHELEADIEPFKGLLLGLFFISVGTNINFPLIAANLSLILSAVFGLILIKFGVLYLLRHFSRGLLRDKLMVAMMLAQGGEFCFVLISYANQLDIINYNLSRELVAVTALSMLLTPLIMLCYEKFIEPKLVNEPPNKADSDVREQTNPVIIAGFGRFGQVVGRYMLANGIGTTILDIDANQVDNLRKFGFKVFYGDARRLELLNTAGLIYAKVLVIAIDDSEKAIEIATKVRQAYPKLKILLRVRGRTQVYEAIKKNIPMRDIYRETFDTALAMGRDTLRILGINKEHTLCSAIKFKQLDEEYLQKMAYLHEDQASEDYISQIRQNTKELENILKADQLSNTDNNA